MFLDDVRITVRAGAGGDGASTFRREAHVPRGGPDGGDGGRGGSIYLRVDAGQTTLHDFRYKHQFKATPGGRGERSRRHGKAGEDLYLAVPPGTGVLDGETGALLADLVAVGQQAMVARGGRGGLGNTHFATATHQAPKHAQRGEPGEDRTIRLELRLIADVGLVGLPNAGKSTLLAALTAATPKIADYPFTTLEPNLGVMDLGMDDGRRPTIADVPGLIEGASSGAGLGHAFLRHVERTRILVHLVDGASRDPRWDHDVIRDELRAHDPALLEKPILVAFNKLDLAAAREAWPAFLREARASGIEALAISADTGEGLDELRAALARLLPDAEGSRRAARARRRGRAPARGPDGRVRRRAGGRGVPGLAAGGSSGSSPRPTSTTRSPRSGSSASSSGRGSTGRCARRGSGRATRCASAAPSWSGSRPRTTVDARQRARLRRPPTSIAGLAGDPGRHVRPDPPRPPRDRRGGPRDPGPRARAARPGRAPAPQAGPAHHRRRAPPGDGPSSRSPATPPSP